MRAARRYLTFLICLCLITQCTPIVRSGARPLQSPYTMSADAYLALANNHMGEEKQALLLLAAGRLIDEGELQQAQHILTQIKPESPLQSDKKNLFLAKVALAKKRPQVALVNLSHIQNVKQLPVYEQVMFHETLAYTYQALHKPFESINEHIQLDRILPDENARESNRRVLWLTLMTLPLAELNTFIIEAKPQTELRGWTELALIARQSIAAPQTILMNITRWQKNYPNHPARFLLPRSLEDIEHHLYAPPKHIALLLPLSGPLAGPGHAVEDGFMAALREQHAVTKTTLRIYDTNRIPAASAYHRAITEGADYVVGPLLKANVAIVAAMQHPVPTLLLNQINSRVQDNAYLFGLSPADEARQIAVKARRAGLSRALIIAPTGTFGDEVRQALITQWRSLRGHVIEELQFDPSEKEHLNEPIRHLLRAIPDSVRKQQIKEKKVTNETPLRREDFDVIFLIGYPSDARQIMPLLRYYYAGNVPVYATSSVYSGTQNTLLDRDLDHIIFCDMPWVFKNPGMKPSHWPENYNSYTRLYALGMDSYALSTSLNALLLFPSLGTDHQTGALYLDTEQRILRILPFGEFKEGVATRL